MIDDEYKVFINPTGRFVIGGPHGDRVLQDVRLSLILTVDMLVTAAVLSPERTAQRLTVLQHMQHVMLQRILLQQDLQTDVRFSFHMQSVLHSQHLSWLIHSEQESLQMTNC